ncbi:MAG: single-stranded DNA-binding protein [Ignavibacteriales bacterium]|nr:single-stranded DNA-binding protein [Ignavibacteriales bacterium]
MEKQTLFTYLGNGLRHYERVKPKFDNFKNNRNFTQHFLSTFIFEREIIMASRSLNKVTLIGHLGKDPEIRYTKSGLAVASFSVATNYQIKDEQGNYQDQTEWHNIVAWGKSAEICGQWLKKGQQIYVDGRLQTRTWDDNTGVKHYKTEIVMNEMIMLGGKRDGGNGNPPSESQSIQQDSSQPPDDLPF